MAAVEISALHSMAPAASSAMLLADPVAGEACPVVALMAMVASSAARAGAGDLVAHSVAERKVASVAWEAALQAVVEWGLRVAECLGLVMALEDSLAGRLRRAVAALVRRHRLRDTLAV